MPPMKIDNEAIRSLAELLDETGLTEIEITEGDQSLRVTRGGSIQAVAASAVPAPANSPAPAEVISTSTDNHPGALKSPMVGTAYLQQDPESPVFVSLGDTVNAGDTLMIIEAMKVMNPIKAEKGGKVTQILIEDSQPVEFDEVLMIIE